MAKKHYRRFEKNIYVEERSGAFRFKVDVSPHRDSATFSTVAEGVSWARRRRLEFLEIRESGQTLPFPATTQTVPAYVGFPYPHHMPAPIKLGEQQFYAQELFEQEELTGYLKTMLQDTAKSIHQHVVYDSTTERDFAQALEFNQDVILYAKLPNWFKVPTPLGNYNPDWAVLLQKDGVQRLYFVVETKSSLFTDDLRDKEWGKIECGKAHFAALAVGESPARYIVARSFEDVMQAVN